jgi:hypothetical protein
MGLKCDVVVDRVVVVDEVEVEVEGVGVVVAGVVVEVVVEVVLSRNEAAVSVPRYRLQTCAWSHLVVWALSRIRMQTRRSVSILDQSTRK